MAGGYSVTITAVDAATKQIDAINKRLQAIHAPVERLSSSLTKFARLSGLKDLATGMGNLARGALNAFRAISQIIAPLAAISGAASLAGMYRLTQTWALWGQHLAVTSARIGTAAASLQTLEGVARLTGASTEALDGAFKTFRDNMAAIAAGGSGSGEQIQWLRQLGLDAGFSARALKDPAAGLDELRLALQKVHDPTLRAAAATALLGGSAEELTTFIGLSTAEYRKLTAAVRAHGTVTEEDIRRARALAQSQANLELAVGGLTNKVAAAVAGPLTSLLDKLTAWIDRNRDLIATKVAEYVERFSRWLQGIDWVKVGDGATQLAAAVGSVATHMADAFSWTEKMGGSLPIMTGAAVALLTPLGGIAGKLALIAALEPTIANYNLNRPGSLLGPAAPAATDTRTWYERFYKSGPGLFGGSGSRGPVRDELSDSYGHERPLDGPRSGTPDEDDWTTRLANAIRGAFSGGSATGRSVFPGGSYAAPAAPGAATGGGPVGSGAGISVTPAMRQAHDYLRSQGWSEAQTDGMLGHLRGEGGNNLDPHAFNPAGGGQGAQGFGQWRGARIDRFREMFGHDPRDGSLGEQLQYMQWELTHSEKASGDALHATDDPARAAQLMTQMYGRPLPQDLPALQQQRGGWGRELYRQFNAQPPAAAGPPVSVAPSAPQSGAANTPAPTTGSGHALVTIMLKGQTAGVTATARGTNMPPPQIERSLPDPFQG